MEGPNHLFWGKIVNLPWTIYWTVPFPVIRKKLCSDVLLLFGGEKVVVQFLLVSCCLIRGGPALVNRLHVCLQRCCHNNFASSLYNFSTTVRTVICNLPPLLPRRVKHKCEPCKGCKLFHMCLTQKRHSLTNSPPLPKKEWLNFS